MRHIIFGFAVLCIASFSILTTGCSSDSDDATGSVTAAPVAAQEQPEQVERPAKAAPAAARAKQERAVQPATG